MADTDRLFATEQLSATDQELTPPTKSTHTNRLKVLIRERLKHWTVHCILLQSFTDTLG